MPRGTRRRPAGSTGEDVLELQAHGGPVVLQLLLARCLEAGAAAGLRVAEPGEFTERAFLNDKIDLAQAEAIADLIDAMANDRGEPVASPKPIAATVQGVLDSGRDPALTCPASSASPAVSCTPGRRRCSRSRTGTA